MKGRRTQGFELIYKGLFLSLISWSLVFLPHFAYDILGTAWVLTYRIDEIIRFLLALVNVMQVLSTLMTINGITSLTGFYPAFHKPLRLVLLRLGVSALSALAESAFITVGNMQLSYDWLDAGQRGMEFVFGVLNLGSYYFLSYAINLALLSALSKVVYDYGDDPGQDRLLKHYRITVTLFTLIPIGVVALAHASSAHFGMSLHLALKILLQKGDGDIIKALWICFIRGALFLCFLGRTLFQLIIIAKFREIGQRIEMISG